MSVEQQSILWGNELSALTASQGWLTRPDSPSSPCVSAARLTIELSAAAEHQVYLYAEERYEFYLNGQLLGRGSERGDLGCRFAESYALSLRAGRNQLLVKFYTLGMKLSPEAQMTDGHGMVLFSAQPATQQLLATGIAAWQIRDLPGYRMFVKHPTHASTGASYLIDGVAYCWDWADTAEGWQEPCRLALPSAMRLFPPSLLPLREELRANGTARYLDMASRPDLTDCPMPTPVDMARNLTAELPAWNAWLAHGEALTVPPHQTRRVIIDLDDYDCFYPALTVSGGKAAQIRFGWLEALGIDSVWPAGTNYSPKGNRNEIAGRYTSGPADVYLPDGGPARTFAPLWWRSGRYLELNIITADEALRLDKLVLFSTGYPLQEEAVFSCSDRPVDAVRPLLVHSLRMCTHETYMDCPFYEQLMYVGDTRLEVLVNYMMTRDHRMPRKALQMFYNSIAACGLGLTESRYPCHNRQIIPPFSLWWIGMLHDYAQWHDQPELIRAMLPGVRSILKAFAATCPSGSTLAVGPVGWNFYDWVGPQWDKGVPQTQKTADYGAFGNFAVWPEFATPGATPTAIMNWHYVWTLRLAAELENYVGEASQAERNLATAQNMVEELVKRFWRDDKGMFADDLEGKYYSEHAQIMALLSGLLPEGLRARNLTALLKTPELSRTTIYFSHYLLETIYHYADYPTLRSHLGLWLSLQDQGFRTTPECPEPSRSDCHAWGAHPYYHYFASLAGIRPVGFGGTDYRIRPIDGMPEQCSGKLPLAQGELVFALRRDGVRLSAEITLPAGIGATLEWQGNRAVLQPGFNRLTL